MVKVYWTNSIEEDIKNGTLSSRVAKLNEQINDIVELVRGKLSSGIRITLSVRVTNSKNIIHPFKTVQIKNSVLKSDTGRKNGHKKAMLKTKKGLFMTGEIILNRLFLNRCTAEKIQL